MNAFGGPAIIARQFAQTLDPRLCVVAFRRLCLFDDVVVFGFE
jgi:hypothetical protein